MPQRIVIDPVSRIEGHAEDQHLPWMKASSPTLGFMSPNFADSRSSVRAGRF